MAGHSAASVPRRMLSLDTVRGAAIIAVLCSHFLGTIRFGDDVDHALIVLGRGGVTLFFLLSGYLIFRNVQTQPIATFIGRRFFKVMPSYWLNIIVILIADLSIDNFTHFPLRSYLASLLAVSDLLGVEPVSGVFWTLLIEIKFYVFIAIQYALFGRRYIHIILVALVMFAVIAWAIRGHGSQLLAYFPVFYLGIEIRLAEEDHWDLQALVRLAAVMVLLAGSLYLCLDQYKLGSAGYLVASSIVFVIALRNNISNRLISILGVTSYSNYLFHAIAGGFVFAMLGYRQGLAEIFGVAAAAIVATATAVVLYRVVEVPMVNLGRRLTARPAP